MKFEIKPDPAFPSGGHALLVVPAGASAGSGRMVMRRLYDGKYLGPDGWQAANTMLGPFETSPVGSGQTVALGPAVVIHLEEFDNLEIAFEGGAKGEAVWPEDILLPPDAASPGGLRRLLEDDGAGPAGNRIRTEAARDTAPAESTRPSPDEPAELQSDAPPAPLADDKPSPVSRKRPRIFAAVAAVLIFGVIGALAAFGQIPYRDIGRLLGLWDGGGEALEACSDAAFDAERDAAPASIIERVYRCAGVEGVSPEVRLSAVERVLDRSPEALVIMGRWYDPAYFEEDSSPFETPAIEIAARYYFEAKEAGVSKARVLLSNACAMLDPNNLMQDNSRQLYCQE